MPKKPRLKKNVTNRTKGKPVTVKAKPVAVLNLWYEELFVFIDRWNKFFTYLAIPILFFGIFIFQRVSLPEEPMSYLNKRFQLVVAVVAMMTFGTMLAGMSGKISVELLGGKLTDAQKTSLKLFLVRSITIIWSCILFFYNQQYKIFDNLIQYLSWDFLVSILKEAQITFSNIVNWIVSGTVGNLFYDLAKRVFTRRGMKT